MRSNNSFHCCTWIYFLLLNSLIRTWGVAGALRKSNPLASSSIEYWVGSQLPRRLVKASSACQWSIALLSLSHQTTCRFYHLQWKKRWIYIEYYTSINVLYWMICCIRSRISTMMARSGAMRKSNEWPVFSGFKILKTSVRIPSWGSCS